MIITLTGENHFMLHQELQRIVTDFVSEHSDMGVERLDGEDVDYDRIRESLESLPFLASKKLVVLRTGSANKQFLEHAERLLKDIPDTTDLVLIEPKLDKRLAYYKLLKKVTDFKEFSELDTNQLATWLVAEVKRQGGEISKVDANFLVNRIGVHQQLLANEVTKLVLYDPLITQQTIELLTDKTPQSTIFDLLDAALSGKSQRALELYDEQRAQRVEAAQIVALLAWQLHILALVKTAGDRDQAAIASAARLSPFVVRKSMVIANRLSLAEVKQLIKNVRTLDTRLKTESIDPDEAMRYLLLQMSEALIDDI